MPRKSKDPYARYAITAEDQVAFCRLRLKPVHKLLGSTNSSAFRDCLTSTIKVVEHVVEKNSYAFIRSDIGMIAEHWSWINALETVLKEYKVQHISSTSDNLIAMGYHLHVLPLMLDVPSVLQEVFARFKGSVSWLHLAHVVSMLDTDSPKYPVKLVPFELRGSDLNDDPIVDPKAEKWALSRSATVSVISSNGQRCLELLRHVKKHKLSPAQLKRRMAKHMRSLDIGQPLSLDFLDGES